MKIPVSITALLLTALMYSTVQGSAEEKQKGILLFNEAVRLDETAKSPADFQRAIEKYVGALEIFEKVAFKAGISAASGNLSIIYRNRGQYDEAVEYCEKSLSVKRELKDRRGEGLTLNYLGNIYKDRGRYEDAVKYYKQSLTIGRGLKDPSIEETALNNLGLVHKTWGQYDKAVEYLRQSLALAREIKDHKSEGQSLNNLANVYKDWGQYDKAIEYLHQSLTLTSEAKDSVSEAQALNNLGNIYQVLSQHDKAVEYYEKSLSISRQVNDAKGEATTLNNLGIVYKDWGRHDKAKEYFEQALSIGRAHENPLGEAVALSNLGAVLKDWGQYENAANNYRQALTIQRNLRYRKGEGNTLNNLGVVHLEWGQYDRAIEYYRQALTISKELKDPWTEGQVLNNLGLVYRASGRYQDAVEHYEQSLAIKRELKTRRDEVPTLANLGVVYSDWGRYDKAVDYYQQSLALAQDLKDPMGEGSSLNNLANVFKTWGQYDKALSYYEESLAVKRRLKDPQGEGLVLSNLAVIYKDQHQYQKALDILNSALEVYQKVGISTNWVKYLIGDLYLDMGDLTRAAPLIQEAGYWAGLGRLYFMKSDYRKARQFYQKLLQQALINRNADNLFISYTGMGLASEGIGDNAGAVEYFRSAIESTEEIRSALSQIERAEFYNVKIWGFLRTAPYDGLARVLIKMNRPGEAFENSELTKARVFAEALSNRSRNSGSHIPKDIVERDSRLNEQLAALKKKLQSAYEKQNTEAIAALEPQLKELKREWAAHVSSLRQDYPLFAATKYPQPMALHETALRDDEWVLAYHVSDPTLIVYLIRGKQLVKAVSRPISRKDLQEAVLSFRKPLEVVPGRDKLADKLQSFDLAAGKKIGDMLLGNLLDFLPVGAEVIIVPDDVLGVLPFEMLALDDAGAINTDKNLPYVAGVDFFTDRNSISYCQSITALSLSRSFARTESAERGLLALADPVFEETDDRATSVPKSEGPTGVMASLFRNLMAVEESGQTGPRFGRLHETADLAKALSAMYDKDSKIYTGFDASKSVFLEKISPSLSQYDKVVFATHGYFGRDLPGIMEPVLILSLVPPGTDGYLRMSEVMNLGMNANIVALTACQTGLGKQTAGEGTMGMGRAFQYAGAKSVLISLWSVSEIVSVNLVKSFFGHIKDGKKKAEALRLARDEIRKQGFDHPFFWAAFILVGETD